MDSSRTDAAPSADATDFSTRIEPRPEQQRFRFAWHVLAMVALVYIGTCFAPVIFDDNEGLYAGAVREMHARGDWLMPTTNGFPRVQKPPLIYWTMLISTSVLGENEFALRLPNALATIGWIVATFLIMRRLGGERFGLAAALVLATMIGVPILFAHLVQPEPFLACFISLAIWCLVEARFEAKPSPKWYMLFWLFLALGAMSKGLHGALWPLGTVVLASIFVPSMRPWLRLVLSLRGVAIFLLLVVPWYAYMTWRLPGFLPAHFLNEQLGASLNTRYPIDAKQLPLVQFYAQHLIFWMPWTLLLPAAIWIAVKGRQLVVSTAISDTIKLLGCWMGLTFISVAFSTRQDYYSMTSWGVVAAFLATPWIFAPPLRLPRAFLAVPCVILTFCGVAALALAAIVPWLGSLGAATASPIQQRDTFMDAIAGISPALWAEFIPLLVIFGTSMLVLGTWATVLSLRLRGFAAVGVLAGAMGIVAILATAGFSKMSPFFSLEQIARAIDREQVRQERYVACEALPNTASSLYAYLNERVHWVNAPFKQDYAQRVLGEGREYYLDDDALLMQWKSPTRVYLIVEQERLAHWQQVLPPGARTAATAGTRLVLCNQ